VHGDDAMTEKNLFRTDVLESRRNRHYGTVLVNTPVHYTVLTVFFSLFAGLVIGFLLVGEFSEKFIVKGYIESTKGVARVYANKNGIIAKCFTKQGDTVKKGEKLFLIDTSDDGVSKKNQHDVLAHLETKKKSLEDEVAHKQRHLQSLKPLLIKKYIPLATYHATQDELAALKHQINSVDIDIINYKHNKSYVIRSPIDGVISSVISQAGQSAHISKPLMKILPSHADLMAELFIPVRQSGFLHKKNQIIVRYDAYPYARFGAATASIYEISKSVLTDDEEEKPIKIGEPYYKISASLDKQFVTVYGKDKKIQHGMTLSAVIVGSKRKLWQWILDPLYSFYGGLFL
jgi:membrane fusion protein